MKTIHELVQTLEEANIEVFKENEREVLNYYPKKDGKVFDFYTFSVKGLDFKIAVLETSPTPEVFEVEFQDYCDRETFEEQSEEVYTFLTKVLKDFPITIEMAW
jgi:hypothetical protein